MREGGRLAVADLSKLGSLPDLEVTGGMEEFKVRVLLRDLDFDLLVSFVWPAPPCCTGVSYFTRDSLKLIYFI